MQTHELRPTHIFVKLPPPTVRLRLSLWYAALFLLAGALLLGLNYLLIRDSFVVSPKDVGIEVAVRLGIPEEQVRPRGDPIYGPVMVGDVPLSTLVDEIEREVTSWSLNQLAVKSGIALGVMALLSLVMGWLLAGRMLRPLQDITSTARRLSASTLKERIAMQGPADELKELSDTFDAMLGRLESAFTAQKEFVANASHELRTPLTIIRTELDVTTSDPAATAEDYKEMASVIRDAVTRSDQLIDRLLFLARVGGSSTREEVDLAEMATRVVDGKRGEAVLRHLSVDATLQPASVVGDPVLLERMIANLVENAIRHNLDHGFVRVETGMEKPTGLRRQHAAGVGTSAAWLRVSNGGSIIPPEDAGRLFERFYRRDRSRSRSTGGFGLGLSIVKAVAEAHEGSVTAVAPPEGGLVVTVRLPAVLA
ncbi:MAG: HAMP domain-containing protein [Gaiellales bacterium]|nr:HAMP domain-containing protein [Gaiellales bacterium]